MDKFEELIKKSVESYEAPYSEAAWSSLSKKLGPERGTGAKWIIGGAITAAAITFGIWYAIPSNSNNQESDSKIVSTNVKTESNTNPTLNTKKTEQISYDSETELNVALENVELTENINNTAILNEEGVNTSEVITNDNLKTNHNDISANNSPVETSDNIVNQPLVLESSPNDIISDDVTDKPFDYTKFNLQVVTNKDELCIGETLELRPSIPKIQARYRWNIGGKVLNGNYVDITLMEIGEHIVILELIDFKTNRVVYSSHEKTIIVKDKPLNEISYEIDNNTIPTAFFEQANKQAKLTEWNIEGVIKTNASAFSHSFRTKGNYIVNCSVTDYNDCVSKASKTITIDNDYNLLAPNAFSPTGNGDFNTRTFIPKALLVTDNQFIMTIYDRRGNLLYETNNAGRPWNGTVSEGGSIAPADAYVWVVQLTKKNGEIEEYKGLVTLIK